MIYYLTLLCLLGMTSKGSDGPSREEYGIDHKTIEMWQNGSNGLTGSSDTELMLDYYAEHE